MAAKGWKMIDRVWVGPAVTELGKSKKQKKASEVSTQLGIGKYPKLFVVENEVDTKNPGDVNANSDVKILTEEIIIDNGYEDVTIIEYHPVAIRKYKRSAVEVK